MWNFGLRVMFFVAISFIVVLFVGVAARLFVFEDARKGPAASGEEQDPSALPPKPSGSTVRA